MEVLRILGLVFAFVILLSLVTGKIEEQELKFPWMITNQNKSIMILGSTPGEIYTTLWKADLIGDPRFRYNDTTSRWVAYDNWTYTHVFDVSKDIMTKKVKYLVFEAVDSSAKIYLNGELIGITQNAFVCYTFNATRLKSSMNNVTVAFMSPVLYAKQQWNNYPYLVPPSCWPPCYKGECHVNFIRTCANNFAWDWSPGFPGIGFWKPVKIFAFDVGRIKGVKFSMSQSKVDNSWSLSADVLLESSTSQTMCVIAVIQELKLNVRKCWTVPIGSQITKQVKIADKIQNVELWWPTGYGKQKLYRCDISLTVNSQLSDTKSVKIGFRTIELIQNPIGGNHTGLSFYIRVNQVNVFIKGSNWVPVDNFLPSVTEERYRYVLWSARWANINMVRVWGGGIFEFDSFYNLADEMGILVWHDMMFACAMYPTNSEFLQNVKTEVFQQVWRLQHHPSIALWSGNNENEQAVATGWYNAGKMNPLYIKDYRKLYVDVIKKLVKQLDPERIFITSSPSNGLVTDKNNGLSPNPLDPLYGDVHYYLYNGNLWDAASFPVTRFTSEFGFQSLPSLATWRTATNFNEELIPDGPLMMYREHFTGTISPIFTITKQYFAVPRSVSEHAQNFTNWVYLSQANQAMIIRTEVEMLRRHQCSVDTNSRGLSMGAMYWMLKDIWQAPSFGSIESTGRWKMVHYFVRHFYADVLISPNLEKNSLSLHLSLTPKKSNVPITFDGNITTTCYSFESLIPLGGWTTTFTRTANCPVIQIYTMPVASALRKCGCRDKKNCLAIFKYTDTSKMQSASNWLLFGKPKEIPFQTLNLNTTNIKITNIERENGLFQIRLLASRPDIFVWLDVEKSIGSFSENGFVIHEKDKTVSFRPYQSLSLSIAEFAKQLTVISLSDLYIV